MAQDQAPFLLSYHSLEVSFTGVGDKYLSCRGPAQGRDIRVLVPDKTIVEDLAASGAPGSVLSAVRKIEQARSKRAGLKFGVLIAFAAIAALLVLGAIAVLKAAEKRAVTLIPPAWESALGKVAAEGILAETKTCSNPEIVRAANEIGTRLVGALSSTTYAYKIRVLDAPEINAFALPGGYVFLNRGLIEAAEDVDEIAGVLAHELEHVQLRHGLSNIARQAGLMLGLSVLIGDLGALEQVLLSNAASLLDMSFSRDQESAADAAGVELMHRAGLDPAGLPRFLAILSSEEGLSGAIPSFLSTHPDSAQRSEALKAIVQRLGPGRRRPLAATIATLRGACDPVHTTDPDTP
jgi:predicted Zn-dependent protease